MRKKPSTASSDYLFFNFLFKTSAVGTQMQEKVVYNAFFADKTVHKWNFTLKSNKWPVHLTKERIAMFQSTTLLIIGIEVEL